MCPELVIAPPKNGDVFQEELLARNCRKGGESQDERSADLGVCSVPAPILYFLTHLQCSRMDKIVDSFAAYFQFPRSATNIYGHSHII